MATGAFGMMACNFTETLALVVLTADFDLSTEYRKGWFEGYARAWTQITGQSEGVLVEMVNEILEGSGKSLERK